jgi:23S rRNA pseudouridine1911/1915/1917 synthase
MVNNEIVPLEVLYEDDALLVVNKPAGIVVHPTSGNWNGTLLNGLLAHLQSRGSPQGSWHKESEPGLVHRLDKETSGVMVVAKTDHAHRILCAQFQHHTITRTYEALVYGSPTDEHGTINLAIGRDAIDGKKVSTNTTKSQSAITEFRVTQRFGNLASHVVLTPRTGRTHQLRVHVASLGCPILGDQVYGGQNVVRVGEMDVPRMLLHARTLGFQHPLLHTFQEYTAGIPSDMQVIYQALQNEYSS